MTSSEPENIWNIVVPIMLIFFIVFTGGLLFWFWSYTEAEMSYTIQFAELNDCGVHNRNFSADSISLSDKDFQVFPKLAPIIRDNTQLPFATDENENRVYRIRITEDERSELLHKFGCCDERIFEYRGRYYSFIPPPLH